MPLNSSGRGFQVVVEDVPVRDQHVTAHISEQQRRQAAPVSEQASARDGRQRVPRRIVHRRFRPVRHDETQARDGRERFRGRIIHRLRRIRDHEKEQGRQQHNHVVVAVRRSCRHPVQRLRVAGDVHYITY